MMYQCPLCHQPLAQSDGNFRCENQHQFDRAKEGYVNLMPAQHKRSKVPGDSKEMMQARRAFLHSGHYAYFADQIAKEVARVTPADGAVLDIGCGEGYYSSIIQKQSGVTLYGIDISKVAIRYAAKRYPNCYFSVASSHRLPFADNSLDCLVRIYAPCKEQEMARVIKPGGHLITVTPGPRHLYQLRALIYDEVKLHTHTETLSAFTLLNHQTLTQTLALPRQDAHQLLQMTPFAWKATEQTAAAIDANASFDCETSFVLHTYQKPR